MPFFHAKAVRRGVLRKTFLYMLPPEAATTATLASRKASTSTESESKSKSKRWCWCSSSSSSSSFDTRSERRRREAEETDEAEDAFKVRDSSDELALVAYAVQSYSTNLGVPTRRRLFLPSRVCDEFVKVIVFSNHSFTAKYTRFAYSRPRVGTEVFIFKRESLGEY